jgi:U3 small nucleolar ribonucleoprotein protein LCP5
MHSWQDPEQLCSVLDDMTSSLSSTRKAIHALLQKCVTRYNTHFTDSPFPACRPAQDLSTSAGISLISLKTHTLLSYIHALVLLTAHRALPAPSSSLTQHAPPATPFSDPDRPPRGTNAGDLVDACIEHRVVLEKVKVLEGRMRYQMDKLVKLAHEGERSHTDGLDGPSLVFASIYLDSRERQ